MFLPRSEFGMPSVVKISRLQIGFYIFLLLTGSSLQCNTGRGSGSRLRRGNKGTPLVHNQHVPNISENTLGASGVAEGRITRHDERFKKLVQNDNPNIVFKDEEGDGSDRIMSQVSLIFILSFKEIIIIVKNGMTRVRVFNFKVVCHF